MPVFEILEPAIDPNNKMGFLLDWELTKKCNLDCSYCPTGVEGGHDNTTKHPPKNECIQALKFMFEYVNEYMKYKPRGFKDVVLNVYGGEALHHPDIVEILSQVQELYQPYADRWHLTVSNTTNAIVSEKKLKNIIPYIDEFTVSFHAETNQKQKTQFKENLLAIKESGKRLKCIVMMHNRPELFEEGQEFLTWLADNQIRSLPKNDDLGTHPYTEQQIKWFDSMYQVKTYGQKINVDMHESPNISETGRACCGGRQSCVDQDYKTRHYFVPDNNFNKWYCSVNEFFLFVRQLTGEVFVNKDCQMNFDGSVSPIGNLSSTDKILDNLKTQLANNTQPIMQCAKSRCICGLCAPKAKNLDTYKSIMKKYQTGRIL